MEKMKIDGQTLIGTVAFMHRDTFSKLIWFGYWYPTSPVDKLQAEQCASHCECESHCGRRETDTGIIFGGNDRNVCVYMFMWFNLFFCTRHAEQFWLFTLCCTNSLSSREKESPERWNGMTWEGCEGGTLTILLLITYFSTLTAFFVLTFYTMYVENLVIFFIVVYFPRSAPELFGKSKFDIIREFVTIIHLLSMDTFDSQCGQFVMITVEKWKLLSMLTDFIAHHINWIQGDYVWKRVVWW